MHLLLYAVANEVVDELKIVSAVRIYAGSQSSPEWPVSFPEPTYPALTGAVTPRLLGFELAPETDGFVASLPIATVDRALGASLRAYLDKTLLVPQRETSPCVRHVSRSILHSL